MYIIVCPNLNFNQKFQMKTAPKKLIPGSIEFYLSVNYCFLLFDRLLRDYLSVIQTLMRMKVCYQKMKKNQVFQIIKMVWVLPTTTSKWTMECSFLRDSSIHLCVVLIGVPMDHFSCFQLQFIKKLENRKSKCASIYIDAMCLESPL